MTTQSPDIAGLVAWEPGQSYCGLPLEAIEHALTIDDRWGAMQFLHDWQHGDLEGWPEYRFKPEAQPYPPSRGGEVDEATRRDIFERALTEAGWGDAMLPARVYDAALIAMATYATHQPVPQVTMDDIAGSYDRWFYASEGFGLRSERAFEDIGPEDKTSLCCWLRAAHEAGWKAALSHSNKAE